MVFFEHFDEVLPSFDPNSNFPVRPIVVLSLGNQGDVKINFLGNS